MTVVRHPPVVLSRKPARIGPALHPGAGATSVSVAHAVPEPGHWAQFVCTGPRVDPMELGRACFSWTERAAGWPIEWKSKVWEDG